MSECPPVPPLAPNELETNGANGIASVLKALGAGPCRTAQAGGLSLLPPGFVGGTASFGCEQIYVASNAVETAMRRTACILNNQNISSTSRLLTTNDVNITTGPGTRICNIDIGQTIEGAVTAVNQFSTTTTNQVSDVMKSMVEQIGNAALEQKVGFLGTTQGQRVVQNFNSYLSQDSTVNSINDWTQSALTQLTANNKVNIVLGPYNIVGVDTARGCQGGITINQSILATLQAQTVVDNVLTNIFSSQQGSEYKSALTATLKAEGEGASSLISAAIGGAIIFIVILVIGGLVFFGGNALKSVFKYVLPILIIVGIALIIYFIVKKQYLYMGITIGAVVLIAALFIYTLFSKPKIPNFKSQVYPNQPALTAAQYQQIFPGKPYPLAVPTAIRPTSVSSTFNASYPTGVSPSMMTPS